MLRSILAVVAGVIVGGLLIAGIEYASTLFFPLPEGVDPMNEADMREIMHTIPLGALVIVILAYFVGVAAGAWTAIRLHPTHARWAGYVVVGLFAIATVANMLSLPHPPWMYVAAPVALVAGLVLALRLAPHERADLPPM
jgi:hypothetical protein